MLPVFSVILEYRKDGRNSSDRPTIKPQSLLHVQSALSPIPSKPRHVHLYPFELYQLHLVTEHAFGRAQMCN